MSQKQEIITFKVDRELAELIKRIPNRSDFIRRAVLSALDNTCPLCQGSGIITVITSYSIHYTKLDDYREAIVQVAGIRLQPILITTLTTVFGMLPLAVGLGEGSNILQPLGIAVSGGLVVSTLFTVYAVPCLLVLTHREGMNRHHRHQDKEGVPS